MTAEPVRVVIAKAPEPGRVKTRLCPPLLPAQAADLAAAALLDSLDAAGPGAVVALTGRLAGAACGAAVRRALATRTVVRQRGTSLGRRIAAAHADAAALAPGRPTLQIGMDTPQVDPAMLADAARMLAGADAVLGPAADGGWWALGLRRPADAAVIAEIPTSRADTGERTLAALRAAGLRVVLLAELTDVDTAPDAVAVAVAAPGTRFAAAVRALPGLTTLTAARAQPRR
ncbi:MAG TPA: DUF2064 domain-containing protein [Pseudonocardia sp.]|nr:DUF2064 domain-containing protein [Pseudonocardia sp.]